MKALDLGSEPGLRAACLGAGALSLLLLALIVLRPPFTDWTATGTSMLTVHLLLELVAVVVAMLVVSIGWHALDGDSAATGSVLITGFTVVAVCDVVHALTYEGLPPLLGEASTPRAIFFWLMGRTAEVLTLGLLALAPQRPLRRGAALALGLGLSAAIVAFGSFGIHGFPLTFVPGEGVTTFKAGYEYLLCAANLAAAALLWRRALRLGGLRARPFYLLATAAFVTGVGEMAFTRYVSPSDFQNIFGHLFKVAAYLLLYRATFVTSVRAPFEALRASRQQVAEREQQLAAILASTVDGIVTLDAQQRIVVFNRAAEQMFGLPADQALGGSLSRFIPRAGPRRIEALARPHAPRLAERRWRLSGRRADGSRFPLELSISRAGEGQQRWLTAVVRDLSTELAVEASRQAQAAAEAASRAKSEFLASMSHEIRTPMNAVLGFTNLALRGPLDERQQQYISRSRMAAESLLGLIDQILDFSKIEAGKLVLEQAPFEVDDLIERVSVINGQLARQKGLLFEVERAPAVPPALVGDVNRLSQVLINLCGNAVKFTSAGRVLLRLDLLALDAQAATLRWVVLDTGIGLTATQISRLFQPFSQADASTSRTHGGTGLGLAISQQLVGLMGGRIEVASEPGRGSEFSFVLRLPIAAQPAPARGEAGTDERRTEQPLSGRRVLLVEDNPFNQQVAGDLLREVAGVQLSVAGDGATALQILQQAPVEAVLLDLQMPGMDGYELARRIRADARWCHLPLIALTAHATDRDRAACIAAGMNDYLSKPFQPEHLFRTLARWLQPAAATAPALAPSGLQAVQPPEPHVDFAVGLRYCGDRRVLQLQVLERFVETQAGVPAAMRSALRSGDRDGAAMLAHGLVATAGTVGAGPLSALARRLELALRQPQGEAVEPLLDTLAEEHEQVLALLRDHLAATA